MGKQAMPLHHCTLPHLPCSYSHSFLSLSLSLSVSFSLFPSLIMPRTVKPAHAAPKFTSEGVLLGHWPPGLAFTPGRCIRDGPLLGVSGPFAWPWWPTAGQGRPAGLAGLHWAGCMKYGHRPSLGSTDPRYQLPSSSPSCLLPFRCCAASLSSHVYF